MLWATSSVAQEINNGPSAADFKQRSDAHIDPATLSMQLQIPLGSYPGRGGADFPITLYYSPKLWRMDYVANYINEGFATYRPGYSQGSASGWTSNLDWFKWQTHGIHTSNGIDSWPEMYDDNGKIVATGGTKTVARIHVTLPDGSSHELRRDDTVWATGSNTTTGTFYSVDGARLRYESASRTLFMPDGSRLIYSYDAGSQPDYIYYIDRNGNQNTYSYATQQWRDSLNRAYSLPPLSNSAVADSSYSVPGVNGVPLTYTFHWRNLSTVLTDMSQPLRYLGDHTWNYPYGTTSNPALFTSPDDSQRVISLNNSPFNPVVLNQIVLPNGETYTFTYNVWGEIDKIVYPTGAYETFSYAAVPALSGQIDDPLYSQINRGVVSRSLSPSGQGGDNQIWQYGSVQDQTGSAPFRLARTITNPDGSYQQNWIHTGRGMAVQYGFEDETIGKAYDERAYTADPNLGGVMLRRTLTDWFAPYTIPRTGVKAYRNARPTKKIEILLDTGGNALTATTTYQYDDDLNVVSTSQYDYASVAAATGQTGASSSIPAGALVRTSETTYLVNDGAIDAGTKSAYRSRQLIALPTSSRVKNSAGTIIAQNSISYDEAAYPLISLGTVTGWTDPATNVRGNPTTTGSWLDTTNTYLQTHAQYDQCGNLTNAWDARGNLTQTQYSSLFAYAYPTTSISAVPGGSYSSATSLVTSTAYDFTTGLVLSMTDANNQTTSYEYNDYLNRLTKIARPNGGWTTYEYTTNQGYGDRLYTRTLQNSGGTVSETYVFHDGLGRPYRTFENESFDPTNIYLTTDTQYDSMGRVWRVSNTYRSVNATAAINPSGIWTTTAYDKLGRVTTVTTVDNAIVTTSYSGNQVTVTDQAGKRRSSVTDALGRLTTVIEDPNGLAYQTDYTYDALGNLRKVTQGTQSRYFMYDSLSRLIRAKNPEQSANANLALTDSVTGNSQWAMAYAYDNTGNLSSRTDARGVTASYTYDGLNRNTLVTYSDGASTTHYFDGAPNGRGRFWLSHHYPVSGAYTQTVIEGYDAVGQPLSQRVNFWTGSAWSAAYMFSRTYDLAGHISSETYPSGSTVSYTYDRMGRTASFTGNLGDSVSRTYMTAIAFDDSGRMIRERFGTDIPLYNKRNWNRRGQLYNMRLSTVDDVDNWNRGAIVNYYSLSNYCFGENCTGTDTNGNLQIQQVYIPNDDLMSSSSLMQDNYGYDSLNRLNWMGEYMNGSGATPSGSQSYDYDRWGNRTINPNTWGTGINNKQFTVDASTNRLGVPSGQSGVMQYDAAGNLSYDSYTGMGSRTYDGENRMVTATDSGGGQSSYVYDGDGRRVRRQTSGQETWQVYGIDGELLAEYAANAAVTSPQKEYGYRNGEMLITAQAGANVQWMVTDQLGTPRMIADRTGSLAGVKRHDYLPFGEELYAGTGNRTTGQGYSVADGVRQKFTSKERDTETGLDYFGARYYSNLQGRFTSPDPLLASGKQAKPQSWNRYAYVLNNPLRLVDPNGLDGEESEDRLIINTWAPRLETTTWGGIQQVLGKINAASQSVLDAMSTARSYSNQILVGPVGSYISDAAAGVLDTVAHRSNELILGPTVGGTVNAIADNPTVKLGIIAMGVGAGGGGAISAQATEGSALTSAALSEANAAQLMSPRPGAAGALQTQSGDVFTATSRGAFNMNPQVQQVLDNIPQNLRSAYHGHCCEVRLLSDALNNGVNPTSGTIDVLRVRAPGNPSHATPLAPCSSCQQLVNSFKLTVHQ